GPDRYIIEGARIEVQRVRAQQQSRMNRKRFGEPVQAKPGQPRPTESDDAEPIVPATEAEGESEATDKSDDGSLTDAEEKDLFETDAEPASETDQEEPEPNVFDELLEEDSEDDGENPFE
ncbi:MAG: hypothetical protein VX431_02590, partial [Planctomycetota bacterium]|nr:hypothetical protein [Planctomycetota bacterium]